MQTASIIIYIYAVLIGIGGFAGYRAAKSLPSLIAGSVSCLVLLAAGYGIGEEKLWCLTLANFLTLVLLAFFGIRYSKSRPRAFMPGGLMVILSMLTLAGIMLAKK